MTVARINEEIDLIDHVGKRLDEIPKLSQAQRTAKERLENQRWKMKTNFDKNLTASDELYVNHKVLLRNEEKKKFSPVWFGPFTIREKFANGTFSLTDSKGNDYGSRVHRNRLRPATVADENLSYKKLTEAGWAYPPRLRREAQSN